METLTDRLLRKFRFLPGAHDAVQIKQIASARRIEDLQRIPRYPPFREGLPVYAPAELLATQHELTGGIHNLIANAELLATHYNPAMLRLSRLGPPLPSPPSPLSCPPRKRIIIAVRAACCATLSKSGCGRCNKPRAS